jgi:hypothetical protein
MSNLSAVAQDGNCARIDCDSFPGTLYAKKMYVTNGKLLAMKCSPFVTYTSPGPNGKLDTGG